MNSLLKIKDLKNYRFFQNFMWDEDNCELFSKNNLIYGWNGSGKTTLCDFFHDLETKKVLDNQTNFTLLFKDSETNNITSFSKPKFSSSHVRIKVFHQSYIQENVIKLDPIDHIFSVGRDQIEKIEEINRLKTSHERECEKKEILENELSIRKKNFERFKTDCAKRIRDDAQFNQSYNKNTFEEKCSSYHSNSIISESEYQSYLTAVRAEKLDEIKLQLLETDFIQITVKEHILQLLNQTPVNNTIESLQSDPLLNDWVEQGLALHENKKATTCFFCGNKIKTNRFEILEAHFNKSYKELSTKIDSAIILLKKRRESFLTYKRNLPAKGLIYTEFRNDYDERKKVVDELCDKYYDLISQIIQLLVEKKSNMICDTYDGRFCRIIEEIDFEYKEFTALNDVIKQHNKKTEFFNDNIKASKNKIEEYHLSKYKETFDKEVNEIKATAENLRITDEQANKIKNKYLSLEAEVKNSQIPADEINKDISLIMGRDELLFVNSELGYQIKRKGEDAKHLSKGEENAIALVYFFNSFMDIDSDIENTIIVLDDPISSFDSNFYYNAISYIKEKTRECGQLFIFTHKFSLVKDITMMYKNDDLHSYLLQRKDGQPHLTKQHKLLSIYHDEYAFLFSEIYNFVKNPPENISEYLRYPNMARRLMESFLTFKIPRGEGSMLDRVQILQNGKDTVGSRAVVRMLNNHSHLRVIKSNDSFDDIDTIESLPEVLNSLMEFIKSHDKMHYDTLALMCDPDYECDGDAVYIKKPVLYKVDLYEMAASAGLGTYADDLISIGSISTTNPDCDFAVTISGDSMEPKIHTGSVALVKKCEEVGRGKIAIVAYQGQCFCKKVVRNEKTLMLYSENKNYPPINVTDISSYKLYGEVIETIDKQE